MTQFRSLLTGLAPAALAILSSCAPAHVDHALAGAPCPAPQAIGTTSRGAIFVVSTNLGECRDGAWDLSRERATAPAYHLAQLGQEGPKVRHWDFSPGDEASWFTALRSQAQAQALAAGATPRVLLYIHGFNNSPDDALNRTRRIAEDTGFSGPVIALIWPSQRGIFKFAADEANNEWTRAYANEVLRKLTAARFDVVLVSHSMGNRIATDALARLNAQSPELTRRVRTVVLASPDIDAGIFDHEVARDIAAPDRTVTIYASNRDKALAASSSLHGYRRVGDLGCKYAHLAVTVDKTLPCYPHVEGASGVRVVDTSAVSQSPFGHTDFIASPAGSADFCRVINRIAERGRRAIPGYAGIFALDASAATRDDCPDTAPPPPPKRKKAKPAAP